MNDAITNLESYLARLAERLAALKRAPRPRHVDDETNALHLAMIDLDARIAGAAKAASCAPCIAASMRDEALTYMADRYPARRKAKAGNGGNAPPGASAIVRSMYEAVGAGESD